MAVDASQLHQIGVAEALYAGDFNDLLNYKTRPLVDLRYVPSVVMVSPLDHTALGAANAWRVAVERRPFPYRDSYLSVTDETTLGAPIADKLVATKGFGWLVSRSTEPHFDSNLDLYGPSDVQHLPFFKGKYLRLYPDASVHVKTYHIGKMPSTGGDYYVGLWLFTDEYELFP